jgi:DNA-binding response OmpR family regulator
MAGSVRRSEEEMSANPDTHTIFLVEERDEARPHLNQNLQRYGYHVIVASDEEDGWGTNGGGRVSADLILVNLVGKSADEVLNIGRRIREQTELNVPLLIMAEKYGRDMDGAGQSQGADVNVGDNAWITYIDDVDQLHHLLARLLYR